VVIENDVGKFVVLGDGDDDVLETDLRILDGKITKPLNSQPTYE
jgi:hypothetical protein